MAPTEMGILGGQLTGGSVGVWTTGKIAKQQHFLQKKTFGVALGVGDLVPKEV